MKVIGVDPGMSGAVAIFDDVFHVIEVTDIPVVIGKNRKKHINDVLLYDWILTRRPYDIAVVENVSARPGQGVTSMFRFGYATGLIMGMIIALEPKTLHQPSPRAWKQDMKLSRDKDMSRHMASRLFPKQARLFELKKHADRAEAALLAVWGRNKGHLS